jgi:signal transduction histidine kinase
MPSLAEVIRKHQDQILERWNREAERSAGARGLGHPEFQDIIPTYLLSLADAGEELGRFTRIRREHVESHFSSRLRQGFQLAEILEEFALLGRCIAATWNLGEGTEPPGHAQIENLFLELQLTSIAVADMFARHMAEDEQTEKRYQRLIQAVAQEALQPGAPALLARLKDALSLVMQAMGAQSAALLLYDSATGNLEIASSVGAADEELERYACSLAQASFAGQVAAGEETTSMWDVAMTDLNVSDALRRSGIHSLLGVRLPRSHRLLGVMYIGLSEAPRAFTDREIRLLQYLGIQLTLHLDNAKLYADLREHIERLHSERELREQFVSVLAHDLRGPISAAKMSALLLIRHPESLDVRRELAVRIDRNIDRTDRMIRDLLDANRVRAGERLPLKIDKCELGSVAREAYEELVAAFGERFVLKAEEHVLGFWSRDELRRALCNLGANAFKYGGTDGPITISVTRTARGAQAAVHNWGNPVSAEDQKQLFRPFSRTHRAQVGGQKGWGLGLTLVQGCAVAHGGQVDVQSTPEDGTTFTLDLPLDARPFQPRPDEPLSPPETPPSTLH